MQAKPCSAAAHAVQPCPPHVDSPPLPRPAPPPPAPASRARWAAAAAGPCRPTCSARCAPRGGCRPPCPRGSRPAAGEREGWGRAVGNTTRAGQQRFGSARGTWQRSSLARRPPPPLPAALPAPPCFKAGPAHLHHPVHGGEVEAARRDVGGKQHHGLGLAELVEDCGGERGAGAGGCLGARSGTAAAAAAAAPATARSGRRHSPRPPAPSTTRRRAPRAHRSCAGSAPSCRAARAAARRGAACGRPRTGSGPACRWTQR